MDEPKKNLAAKYLKVKEEFDGLIMNRSIWATLSVVLALWLVPFGVSATLLGVLMFFVGTRWFKNYTLSCISEHKLFLAAKELDGSGESLEQ